MLARFDRINKAPFFTSARNSCTVYLDISGSAQKYDEFLADVPYEIKHPCNRRRI
jgi:hypothetical protein